MAVVVSSIRYLAMINKNRLNMIQFNKKYYKESK